MPITFNLNERDVSYTVEVRNSLGNVIGRGILVRNTDPAQVNQDRYFIHMKQTYGGSTEGTLDAPVKADIEVLRQFVAAADQVASQNP